MKAIIASLLVAGAHGAEVTPVQKVITLLENMLTKGKKEKHEEQVQFAAYKQWCDDTTVEKQRLIKDAEEKIEGLKADIQKGTSDIEELSKEIHGHDADVAAWQGDTKAATAVRGIERTDYQTTHRDYSESIDALQRAIAVLKKEAYDRKQKGEALVELKAMPLIPKEAKKAINAFLQEDPSEEGLSVSAPEANAYEFQSSGIVEMLEKLQDKFVEEKTVLEKEEANSKHAFDMLMQDLAAQIDQGERDRSSKTELKAKTQQKKADDEGDLKDTTTTKEEDEKYLSDMTATCKLKSSDFESRQQLRTEEVEAIQKAIDIISSDTVKGSADKHLPAMLQTPTLAHLRSEPTNLNQVHVAQFLRDRGDMLHSHILTALSVRVADDPFVKVKKMIKDLIVRLMEEANEEAEHKGWCDTELTANEQTRKEKTEAVETLHAENDQLSASISQLTEELTELSKAVSDLDSAMAEQTKMRQEEKATNTATISDAQEAQTAVAQALVVLKEFYAKAAEATAFVQKRREEPEIFDKPYQGMGSESGGVIGMLEVIESDFARLETDTESAEATAQREYDNFMTDSKVDKASKSKSIEHKTNKRTDEEGALTSNRADLEGTQKELDAALAYFDKLKPSCVDSGESFEDRVARRKEEIESLQEALRILNGEDIA